MDASASVTTRGRVTVPKEVRDALGLREGDRVLFRVTDGAAVLVRIPNLLELAGVVPVPAGAASLDQDMERRRARERRAHRST